MIQPRLKVIAYFRRSGPGCTRRCGYRAPASRKRRRVRLHPVHRRAQVVVADLPGRDSDPHHRPPLERGVPDPGWAAAVVRSRHRPQLGQPTRCPVVSASSLSSPAASAAASTRNPSNPSSSAISAAVPSSITWVLHGRGHLIVKAPGPTLSPHVSLGVSPGTPRFAAKSR